MLNKKFLLINIFIFSMVLGVIFFYTSLQTTYSERETTTILTFETKNTLKTSSVDIPTNYSQNLDLDAIYEYNVTQFGDVEAWWWYFYDADRGHWKTDPGGKVKINFTGFYNRDPRDWGDAFPDTDMPYYDIEIFNSTDPTPIFQEANLSNSEVSVSMCLGYNSFQPGYLIPIDNLTNIKKLAIEQANGYSNGKVIVEETFNFLYISFRSDDGIINTYLMYDRSTGLLVWANTTSYFGYKLEIYSVNYTFNSNLTYNYTINEFGEPIGWFNLSGDFKGKANTNSNGIISINFTGSFNKDLKDKTVFENPIPWIDILFIENNSGILFTNFTLNNISNSEAALNLHIGFNNFSSGFRIPSENIADVKLKAESEGSGEKANGFLIIKETGLTIEFAFIETGGENFSAATYDKRTGLLMSIRAVSGNFLLDMELVISYEESNPTQPPPPDSKTVYIVEEEIEKGENEFADFTIPFLLLGCGAVTSVGLLVWKKDIKMLKYLFTGIFGSICFSTLFTFNYWLTTGVASSEENSSETPLEVVEDITLIVDFGDGNIKTWEDFTLTGGKTTVLDALDKHCEIKYDDYGWGVLVTEIDGVEGDWIYEVNGEKPNHGADRHNLRDGDEIKWILV